jgi:tRNA(Ile)-lysidine synthase
LAVAQASCLWGQRTSCPLRISARAPKKELALHCALDVERWALDVREVKVQQRRALIESERFVRDFPRNRRYLIGVSGGRDSIALLSLLVDLGYKKLVVCHLNHQLRGAASRGDARFVEKVARNLGLDCEIRSTDVGALAKRSKLSIETAARFARLAFFVAVACRRRCPRIVLAHHADDLVETALLNLFRGAGPGGVAAMRKISIHRIGKTTLTILRPLLGVWRSEIDSYVSQCHLEFREDATNAALHSSRNKIRHRILPDMEKQFGRDVRKTIWRAAQIWSEEEVVLDSLVSTETISAADLAVAALRKMPVALQRRAILKWLRARKITDVNFDVVENIRSLIEPGAKIAKVNLPRDQHARRRAGKIFVD